MSDSAGSHYDKDYFDWQAPIGEFGGWANQTKFNAYISPESRVLDFGCGGGYLLKNFNCALKVGVEINPTAAETARMNGLEVYGRSAEVPDNYVDIIISNNALEHTRHPLEELRTLLKKLEPNGKAVFVVPCESVAMAYKPHDINYHLYCWSPMCIGNLFTEAGFSIIESQPYLHKWPPKYRFVARVGGRKLFEAACRLTGRIRRSWVQVRVVAEKKAV